MLACFRRRFKAFLRNGRRNLWYEHVLLKFVYKTRVCIARVLWSYFVMASKRRRSESSPQTPVLQCFLDVRFQTQTKKEAFIAWLVARDPFPQQNEKKWTCSQAFSQFFSLAETRPLSQRCQGAVLLLIRLDQQVRCLSLCCTGWNEIYSLWVT